MKFIDISLCNIFENNNSKIYNRSSVIVESLVNSKIQIYSGMNFRSVNVLDIHLNHKIGELVFTRVNCEHLHKKKRQSLKSKKNVKN